MDKAQFIGGISIRKALEITRNTLSLFSGSTATTIDDRLLELTDALLASDELLSWFEGLVTGNEQPAVLPAGMPASAGIQSILLPLLIELVKSLLDR